MDTLPIGTSHSTSVSHSAIGRDGAHGYPRGETMRRRFALKQVAGEIVAGWPALPETGRCAS